MGGFFGGLVGVGQAAEDIAQGRELNRQRAMQEKEFAQKQHQFEAWLEQMRSQLASQEEQRDIQKQQAELTAKGIKFDWAHQYKDEAGKVFVLGVDPMGKVTRFYTGGTPIQKSPSFKVEAKGMLGKDITDKDVDAFGAPIDRNPKSNKTYDRVWTGEDWVYMPGAAPKPQSQSLMSMITRANAGDKEAQDALKRYQSMQVELAGARGAGYGAGRAKYMLSQYTDQETGEPVTLSNYDAIQEIERGRKLMLTGRLPFQTAVAVQQLVSESYPALDGVRASLESFDNAKDRAIFARVLEGSGMPVRGAETTWFGNVLNQVAISDLSPKGKDLVVSLRRLNETMGRLRSIVGLPATDTSMALTLSLLPGPSSPDSKFARQQLDQLEAIVTQAVQIPAYGGGGIAGRGENKTPPKGAKIRDYSQVK